MAPPPPPLPSAPPPGAARVAAFLVLTGLVLGLGGFEMARHGWLGPQAALTICGALEMTAIAFAAAHVVRVKSRELDAAHANLRAATKVNALLALVAQHMLNAVVIADGTGTILWTNVACEQLSGLSQAESVRRPVAELLSRIMSGFAPEDAALLIEAGQSAAIESTDTSPDGKVRWYSVTFQPVRNARQEVVNFIVMLDDFTAFREAHLRQRHSEEIAIQVSRMAQIGAWELLFPDHGMQWEPELYRICQVELGYRPTLDKMASFFSEEGREGFLRGIRKAIQHGQTFDMECALATASGEQRWVQIFGWPEISAGKPVRLFGTVQDITARHAAEQERRTMEGQLFQLQKMETLGTLAGGIAHDFNNLLTGIIGNQDLALDDLAAGHAARRRLEEARGATLLACELVDQILTFSRQTGGERVSTDLGAVIEEARRFLRASVPASVKIEVAVAPGCGRVMADVAQLNQVLLNLGSNGAHAMRSTGGVLAFALTPVTMTATQAAARGNLPVGPYVRINVHDTGHGMDPETQRRIFNPFFTTKSAGEGTGLGLAIVRTIIRSHNGAIEVASSIGEGTSVDVYLPVVDIEDHAAAAAVPTPVPRGAGEIVCIVDDEQIVAQTSQVTLERLGYRTVVYHSPLDCLAALKAEAGLCSLLLTDQTMPEMDGIELSRQVRAFAPRLPIIIMSGYFSKISPSTLEQLGHVSLLPKPFRSGEIARTVQQALRPAEIELSLPEPG